MKVFHLNDPDHINLRKAARAAIVSPLILLIAHVGFDQMLLGVFGYLSAFCAFVFADFGGPIRGRVFSYLILLVATSVTLVAGSLLAGATGSAGIVMAIIVFTVLFAGVFSPYAPAFVAPVALAFAFAVFIPLETIGLVDRLVGWSIGSVAAAIGAVLLWPVNNRADIRTALAAASASLAEALSKRDNTAARTAAMKKAAAALAVARTKATAPLRPARVAAHDLGLLNLLEGLTGAHELIGEVLEVPEKSQDASLVSHATSALQQVDAVVSGRAPPRSIAAAIGQLDRCLVDRRHAMASEVRTIVAQDGDADAANALNKSFPLLALSHLILWVEADAAEAMGAGKQVHAVDSAPELRSEIGAGSSAFLRLRGVARANLDPDGVVFRNSVRGAVAMGLGVIVAKLAPIDHGFWIVLGVLTVLRSSVTSTSATALWAIAGTTVGFAFSAAILLVVGGDTSGLWWFLPAMVFLAGYAPGAIGFAVGQVAFTVMVVCLFDIIEPQGVTTAIVRLEAVSLGAVSAAIVALILWPRGARAALARSIAAVYRTASQGMSVLLTGSQADRQEAAERLEATIERATSAFAVALGEHGERIDATTWAGIDRPPAVVHALLCGLEPAFPDAPPPGCAKASKNAQKHASAMAARFDAIAGDLDSRSVRSTRPDAHDPGQSITGQNDCLCACARKDGDDMQGALAIVGWSCWLNRLDSALSQAATAQASVAGAASNRRWLRWSLKPAT